MKDEFVGEVTEERKMGYKSLEWAYRAGSRGGTPWLWEWKEGPGLQPGVVRHLPVTLKSLGWKSGCWLGPSLALIEFI